MRNSLEEFVTNLNNFYCVKKINKLRILKLSSLSSKEKRGVEVNEQIPNWVLGKSSNIVVHYEEKR